MITRRARAYFFLLVTAIFTVSGDARAEVPSEVHGRPVASFELRTPSGSTETAPELEPFVGRRVDRAMLRELVAALIATERFADVQVDAELTADPLVLEIRVTPRRRVQRVDVYGNSMFDDAEVRDRIGLTAGDDIDRSATPRFEAALLEAYRGHGYDAATATIRVLDTDDESSVVVQVEIVEGNPTRIEEVRFGAALPPDWPSPLRALRRLEGDRLDRNRLDRARTTALGKLREAGFLEATIGELVVIREGSRAYVDAPLVLGPRYRIVVLGNAPLSRNQVVSAIDRTLLTADDAGLAAANGRATDLYRKAGFLDATSTIEVERDVEEGVHAIVVTIDRGPAVWVDEVRFEGATHFTASYLRDQLDTFLDQDLRGPFGAPLDRDVLDRTIGGRGIDEPRRQPDPMYVPPEQIFYAPTYTRALEHLTTLYREAGFMDVVIGEPNIERIDERTMKVSISVEEGPRTLFHDIVVVGNAAVDDATIAAAIGLSRGDHFSETALASAIERTLDVYRSRGFLYTTVTQTVTFSRSRTNAAVELVVNERFPVHVGAIHIVGARMTRDSLVRSMVAMQPGELFTLSAARRTEERLLELGIFGSVVVGPADPDIAAPIKDIVVTVAERLPQVLDFGAGISTGQGVRGSFEYSYRNLFGRAITFTLRAQLSGQFFFLDPVLEKRFETLTLAERLERRVTMSLVLPILGSNPNFRASFNILNLRDNNRTFGIDKSAVDMTFAYRPSRRFSVSVSPSLERNNVQLLVRDQTYEELLRNASGPTRQLLLVPEGTSTLFAFGTQLVVDRRNNPFAPTRGYYLSAGAEWARTLTSSNIERGTEIEETFRSNHVRLTGSASTYVHFLEALTLALQLKMGGIAHLSENSRTFPNRQFFLGGVDTMRSYRQDAMIPQDVIDTIARTGVDPVLLVQGGEISLLVRSELRFPVVGSLSAAVFGEFGNLWADVSNFEPWRLRPSLGVGIRLDTPVGPIALDYGFNVLYRQADRQAVGERIGAFNFSIGVF